MNAIPSGHRLIRQIDTGLYLSADGRWVSSANEAFDFPDLRSALATYEHLADKHAEMIMIFDAVAQPPPSVPVAAV